MYCVVSFQVYLRLRKKAKFLPDQGIQLHVPFGHWMGLRDKSKHMLWSVPYEVVSHLSSLIKKKTVGANATHGFHKNTTTSWSYSTTHHFPINASLRSWTGWTVLWDELNFPFWSASVFSTRVTVCGLKHLQWCGKEQKELSKRQVISPGLSVTIWKHRKFTELCTFRICVSQHSLVIHR